MGAIKDQADQVFRDFVVDGVVTSGAHSPARADVRAWGATIDTRVAEIAAAQVSGYVAFESWALLAANPGDSIGDYAIVTAGDTGTHTDPVVGGTVNNAGQYRWSVSPAGWRRIGDLVTGGGGASQTALDAEIAARLAGDQALQTSVAVLARENANDERRPGEVPSLYSANLVGRPEALAGLTAAAVLVTAAGAAYRVSGAGVVAQKKAIRLDAGRKFKCRTVYRRSTDSSDPANDGVVTALRWLDKDFASIGFQQVVIDGGATIASGRRENEFVFPSGSVAPLPGAVYARLYVQTFGSTPVTDLEEIGWQDFTEIDALEQLDIAAAVAAVEADRAEVAANRLAVAADAAAADADALTAFNSSVSAQNSASSAAASATAAASLIGAGLYATKAAADAALAGVAANAFVVVLTDESQGNQVTIYQKVSGSYVFRRTLADVSTFNLLNRYGEGQRARNTLAALARWNTDFIGSIGVGNPNVFPATITASQSGTTVTASAAVFNKTHARTIIRWSTGEEAVITDVNSYTNTTTCTVDRSQTVSSGSAVVMQKHVVGLNYGDSLGNRPSGIFQKLLWRALGFGGYIFQANNADGNSVGQVASVTTGGGASLVVSTNEYNIAPWSSYWSVPAGGTVDFTLQTQNGSGIFRTLRNSLTDVERAHNSALMAWRRGPGAGVVLRRRAQDPSWETVETISDMSAGTSAFSFRRYSHPMRADWIYRFQSTSGTAIIPLAGFFNNTRPGFVSWMMSRGGGDISQFDALPASELAELCRLVGQPDFRFVISADGLPGVFDPSSYLADIAADRTLWSTAAPICDHIWCEIWENFNPNTTEARNAALLLSAISNGDCYVPLYDSFGPFTQASARGILEDGIHPQEVGSTILAHRFLTVLGIADFPTIRESRDIDAFRASVSSLTVGGTPFSEFATAARFAKKTRGARWNSNTHGILGNLTALPSAIGTGEFTIMLDIDAISPAATQYLAVVSTAGGIVENGALEVYMIGNQLRVLLRNGSAAVGEYRYDLFGSYYANARRQIVIRSDRSNARMDVFVDGFPATGLTPTTNGAGDYIGSWSGTGTAFVMPQGALLANSSTMYAAMYFASRLTDAQIRQIFTTDAPPSGATPEVWYTFEEEGGRIVVDRSGNNRNAMWLLGNPSQYNLATLPTWRFTSQGLKTPWVASLNATTTLVAGDDVIATHSSARDYLLPAVPRIGDEVRITKNTSAQVRFSTPALHQIKTGAGTTVGTDATTIGTAGRLSINTNNGAAHLKCTRAEPGVAFEWAVVDAVGALVWT